MSMVPSARDVYEMAMQLEENGARFYRKAAELVSESETRATLLELAAQEDGHQKLFENMRMALRVAADPKWDEYNAEALAYLQAFASGRVFDVTADISGEVGESMAPGEILMLAAGKERDSILFFLGMKDLAPTSADQDKIEAVIKEEKSHLTLLLDRIEQYGGV